MKKVKCLRLTLDVLNPCGGWVRPNHSQRFEFFLKRHLLAIVKLCVTIFRPLDRFAFLVFADPPPPLPSPFAQRQTFAIFWTICLNVKSSEKALFELQMASSPPLPLQLCP